MYVKCQQSWKTMPSSWINRFSIPVIWLILPRQTSEGQGAQWGMWPRVSSSGPSALNEGIASPLFSFGEMWPPALSHCRLWLSPFQPDFKSARGRVDLLKEENSGRWCACLPSESCFVLCICANQLVFTDLTSTLWTHKSSFFSAESVTECHGGHGTRCKPIPDDLREDKLL